ncbi:MAG: hypothetical protein ABIO40_03655, partial [Devosia sp.]
MATFAIAAEPGPDPIAFRLARLAAKGPLPLSAGPMAIHIALTFDDNFWAPAYTVARSICLTTK